MTDELMQRLSSMETRWRTLASEMSAMTTEIENLRSDVDHLQSNTFTAQDRERMKQMIIYLEFLLRLRNFIVWVLPIITAILAWYMRGST